jgi:putative NADH-flavin reductase
MSGGSTRALTGVATVLIIGASRGIGFETLKAALETGHSVRALARSARRILVSHPKLEKIAGDALEMATVKRALTGIDAVIQSLGVSVGPEIIFEPTRLFSKATQVLVTAMEEAGIKRLICVRRATVAAVAGFFIAWLSICCWGASMTTRTYRNASSAGASSTG